jgi:hypothetical protein
MPVKVLIWDYHGISHCGHAAIQINHGAYEAYCSWWPTSDKAKKLAKDKTGGLTPPWKARGVGERTYEVDMRAECGINFRFPHADVAAGRIPLRPGQILMGMNEDRMAAIGQQPQHEIVIPGIQDGVAVAGLDLERMIAAWDLIKLNPNKQYRFISKEYNCASVAAALLMVGGAGFYSEIATQKKPNLGNMYIQPNNVRKWAEEIKEGIQTARQAREGAVQPTFGRDGAPMMEAPDGREIMSVDAWKRLSHVAASWSTGLARRIDQVAKIDTHLARFHTLGAWNYGNFAQCQEKMKLMGSMLREISSHIADKPNSTRRDAVLQLGAQIMAHYTIVAEQFELHFRRPTMLEVVQGNIAER